jgi:hypothetical protein
MLRLCIFVLIIRHENRIYVRHVIWGISGSTVFLATDMKLYFDFIYNSYLKVLSTEEESTIQIYVNLHVRCPLFLSGYNQNWIWWNNFSQNPEHNL